METSASGTTFVYRRWSDGSMDLFETNLQGPGNVPVTWWGFIDLPEVARADLNANGCVDVPDLLELLAAWDNDCPP